MTNNQKHLSIWEELNDRQKTYLRLIFELDQKREKSERSGDWQRFKSRPASEWRWIEYSELFGISSELRRRYQGCQLQLRRLFVGVDLAAAPRLQRWRVNKRARSGCWGQARISHRYYQVRPALLSIELAKIPGALPRCGRPRAKPPNQNYFGL